MRTSFTFAILLLSLLSALPAAAEGDPRYDQAADAFRSEDYETAARLFEEINSDTPANHLRLNAMVAWFKADRCLEAMAAHQTVDRKSPLESRDIQDLTKVEAYCTLQTAQAEYDAGQFDRALATLDGVAPQRSEYHDQLLELRAKVLAAQATAKEAATNDVVTPPLTEQPERHRPRRIAGISLLGVGGAAIIGASAKFGIERGKFARGKERFADTVCDATCQDDSAQLSEGRANYDEWLGQVRSANLATGVILGTGVAAAVVGSILYFGGSESEPSALLVPDIGAGRAGATFLLRF